MTVSTNSFRTGLPGSLPAMRARMVSDLGVFPQGLVGLCRCDTVDFDDLKCYTIADGRFTPKISGLYQVDAQLQLNCSAGANYAFSLLYKNASLYSRGDTIQLNNSMTTTDPGGSLSDVIPLVVGDFIDIRGNLGGAGDWTIKGGGLTRFAVTLIKPL